MHAYRVYIPKSFLEAPEDLRAPPIVSATDQGPLLSGLVALPSLFQKLYSRVAFPGLRGAYSRARNLEVARRRCAQRPGLRLFLWILWRRLEIEFISRHPSSFLALGEDILCEAAALGGSCGVHETSRSFHPDIGVLLYSLPEKLSLLRAAAKAATISACHRASIYLRPLGLEAATALFRPPPLGCCLRPPRPHLPCPIGIRVRYYSSKQ